MSFRRLHVNSALSRGCPTVELMNSNRILKAPTNLFRLGSIESFLAYPWSWLRLIGSWDLAPEHQFSERRSTRLYFPRYSLHSVRTVIPLEIHLLELCPLQLDACRLIEIARQSKWTWRHIDWPNIALKNCEGEGNAKQNSCFSEGNS